MKKVEKMGGRYQFMEGEIEKIEEARRINKDKRAEQRLKALELRTKGGNAKADYWFIRIGNKLSKEKREW